MAGVSADSPPRTHVAAALLALAAALLCRAWLQVTLEAAGLDRRSAADLSYFIVPPLLLVLLLPVLRADQGFLRTLLRFRPVTLRLLLVAVAIGLLLRIAWWSQLVARISFGWQSSTDPLAIAGPVASFSCPPTATLVAGIVVATLLIPPIEELIHRGYVQTRFHSRGPVLAITMSTLLFVVFHRTSGWGLALAGGAILGSIYWASRSLWPGIVTHSVVNLEPQITWRCLNLHWNPAPDTLPLWSAGIPATLVFCLSVGLMAWLILGPISVNRPRGNAGAGNESRRPDITAR
jgi:membrane protease YdiL (CAAX protease family)